MRVLLIFLLLILSLQVHAQDGVAPGAGAMFGPETGINTRFYYFPNEKMCFGPEFNMYPGEGHSITENFEIVFNYHYIFKVHHRIGLYPIVGVGWKKVPGESEGEHSENGWRGNIGPGMHFEFGRWVPYTEYIYSVGFENEGTFIIGTFFKFNFGKSHEKELHH